MATPTKQATLNVQAANTETPEQTIARLTAELAAANAKKAGNGVISLKVTNGAISAQTGKATTKGAISVYGLGRFPITLYLNQWQRLSEVLSGQTDCKIVGQDGVIKWSSLVEQASKAGLLSIRE